MVNHQFIDTPKKVDDELFGINLSVDRALGLMNDSDRKNYGALYEWFIQNTDTIGSRLYGIRLPGVDVDFKHAAQRGIHAPAGRKYAASVTIKKDSMYSTDGDMVHVENGTWIVFYSAHRNNAGGKTNPIWNQKLINCLADGVPVGLFMQKHNSSNGYYRALAFVEEFDPDTEIFTLHGPVMPETIQLFSSSYLDKNTYNTAYANAPSTEDLAKDGRKITDARKVLRAGQQAFRRELITAYKGQCAVCGCNVEPILEAAHIIDYRGIPSNIVPNGMLLRADIHTLFDRALIAINPNTFTVELNERLANTEYERLEGNKLILPKDTNLYPKEEYLQAKYVRFQMACA